MDKWIIRIAIFIIACAFGSIVADGVCTDIDEMEARIDFLENANERLGDMYTDLEFENRELRETNSALASDNEALREANSALMNRPPEIVYRTEYVEVPSEDDYIECGGCGAHVHDWYYIQNMSGTAQVEVCRDCYDASIAYYNGDSVEQTIIEVED